MPQIGPEPAGIGDKTKKNTKGEECAKKGKQVAWAHEEEKMRGKGIMHERVAMWLHWATAHRSAPAEVFQIHKRVYIQLAVWDGVGRRRAIGVALS